MVLARTNVYDKFQTVIPKRVREELGITKKDTVIEWIINQRGNAELIFRKRLTDDDMIGLIKTKEKTNALELEKDIYKKNE